MSAAILVVEKKVSIILRW